MREFFMPVILQLAGVIIIVAEIFLPSGGLLSLVALLRKKHDLAYGPAIALGMLWVTLSHGGWIRLWA